MLTTGFTGRFRRSAGLAGLNPVHAEGQLGVVPSGLRDIGLKKKLSQLEKGEKWENYQ